MLAGVLVIAFIALGRAWRSMLPLACTLVALVCVNGCDSGGGGQNPRSLELALTSVDAIDLETLDVVGVDGLPTGAWRFDI
jgi:hypothetical protein